MLQAALHSVVLAVSGNASQPPQLQRHHRRPARLNPEKYLITILNGRYLKG